MAVYADIDKVDVGVYDKVREYYKADKYLGGLIKIFRTIHADRIGRTIAIIIPQLDRYDVITINGIEYRATPQQSTSPDGSAE